MNSCPSEYTLSASKEESIAKAMQMLQENAPSQQPLRRPDIPTLRYLMRLALWIGASVAFSALCLHIGALYQLSEWIPKLVAAVGCCLIFVFWAKVLIRTAVLLYQKLAPEKVRRACRFVPSCSEYMLLAIEKYGVWVGVFKGFCRLCRCHSPNGGEDYP
jgi:putative component of membrane protein insertase Oxa1/YidC/SpoIIIJ protein YidD